MRVFDVCHVETKKVINVTFIPNLSTQKLCSSKSLPVLSRRKPKKKCMFIYLNIDNLTQSHNVRLLKIKSRIREFIWRGTTSVNSARGVNLLWLRNVALAKQSRGEKKKMKKVNKNRPKWYVYVLCTCVR